MNKIILVARQDVSTQDIETIERSLGIGFPTDFKNWILENGIGYPQPNCFKMGNDINVFNNFIGFSEESYTNIIKIVEELQDRLPSHLIPFGEDPFGNLLCIDYSNNQSIVFWDHEILDLDHQKIIFVAETFTTFLEMLFPDPEDDE